MLESVFRILPATLAAIIDGLVEASKSKLEEIRIRENRPLEIVAAGSSLLLLEMAARSLPQAMHTDRAKTIVCDCLIS